MSNNISFRRCGFDFSKVLCWGVYEDKFLYIVFSTSSDHWLTLSPSHPDYAEVLEFLTKGWA